MPHLGRIVQRVTCRTPSSGLPAASGGGQAPRGIADVLVMGRLGSGTRTENPLSITSTVREESSGNNRRISLEFASTNLVIELGISLWVLMG